MNQQLWISVILSALLFLLLVWKEVSRARRANLFLRLLASLVATASLAFFILPWQVQQSAPKQAWLVLTPGFEDDSLQLRGDSNYRVFTLDPLIYHQARTRYNCQIISADELKKQAQGKLLRVLGWGLNKTELKALNNQPISFEAPRALPGLQRLSWTKRLRQGQAFRIQGIFSNPSPQDLQVMLTGGGGRLDSTIVQRDSTMFIELKTAPRQLGKALYRLVVVHGADTLSDDPLPFDLAPVKPVSVLMLNSSPGFETRFLRNWLGENRYIIRSRTRITTGRFEKAFLNTAVESFGGLTKGLLEKTDLIITDPEELRLLPAAETRLIMEQVSSSGLGLVLRSDSNASSGAFYSRGIDFTSMSNLKPLLNWLGAPGPTTFPTPLTLAIKTSADSKPLITDQSGNIIAASTLFGRGRIVTVLGGNSYVLKLSGADQAYESYWSGLLGEAGGDKETTEHAAFDPIFPVKNEPLAIRFTGPIKAHPQFAAEGISLAPLQDHLVDDEWSAAHWPLKEGWMQISGPDTLNQWVYIYAGSDWAGFKQYERTTATLKHMAGLTASTLITKDNEEKLSGRLSLYWFFFAFLIAATYLWLENKYGKLS